jgi:O-antigen/teichoic acid export membrane protein/thymidylate kinase
MTASTAIEDVPRSLSPREKGGMLGLGRNAWAVADQMLISATNFVTMIFLARGLSRADFGEFTLVYSVLLFANSIQSGLITQPHGILGATRRGKEYATYTTTTGVSQVILAGFASLLTLLTWGIVALLGWDSAPLVLALVPSIMAWQLQEFFRRVLYTEGRLDAAFANDVISYGGQAVAIVALEFSDQLTAPLALYALAVTSAIAAVLGVWQIRGSLTRRIDPTVFRENWHFGKWIAGGDIVGQWLSTQMFVYLAAALIGAAAAGVLRAVHTIFGPTRVLAYLFVTVLPIGFAKTLAAQGKQVLHTKLKLAAATALPILGGYCLLVALLAGHLLKWLYRNRYDGNASVLSLYALATFMSYVAMLIAAALRAKRMTRSLFIGQLYASLIAIPIGWITIHALGTIGAVLGMTVTYLALSFLFWRAYRRDQQGHLPPVGAATDAATASALLTSPRQATGAAAILGGVLQTFDRQHVPYCLQHGYATYPDRVPSDVDCMVPARLLPDGLAWLLHDNRSAIGARPVQWVRDATEYVLLAGENADGSACFLPLDVSGHYDLCRRRFYRGESFLAGRRRSDSHGGIWVPSPGIEFGGYLVRKVAKGDLNAEHGLRLSELYRQDPNVCEVQVRRFWNAADAATIIAAAARDDWRPVIANVDRLRARLLRGVALRRPLNTLMRVCDRALNKLKRWFGARGGLHVILLGPDGAGKSSVTAALRRDLAPAFARSTALSFPPALRNRGGPGGTETAPHSVKPRSFLSSCIRAACYWFVYYGPGYWLTTFPKLARMSLVIHDRHLVDALVDPRRYRYTGPAWLLRLIWRLVPKPDLVILLHAPAEVVQRRKQEVPLAETARQLEAYRGLVANMPNGSIVDASRPLEQVVADVERIVLGFMARRVQRRFGMLAGSGGAAAHAHVAEVLRQFTGSRADRWHIEALGGGRQADIFLARAQDGGPAWGPHRQLVVKLYKPHMMDHTEVPRHEFDGLTQLDEKLHGSEIGGWRVHSPKPLFKCEYPFALVMTPVPGKPINAYLESDGALDDDTIQSLATVVVSALQRYWSDGRRIYGDIDFNNILCDLDARELSFVDPGIPEDAYLCEEVPKRWYPRSRDLAYMLFDVASSVNASLMNPAAQARRKRLIEAMLRQAAKRSAAEGAQTQELLEEIRACAAVHMRRIPVSASPVGVWRWLVRRSVHRTLQEVLGRLASPPHPSPVTLLQAVEHDGEAL